MRIGHRRAGAIVDFTATRLHADGRPKRRPTALVKESFFTNAYDMLKWWRTIWRN